MTLTENERLYLNKGLIHLENAIVKEITESYKIEEKRNKAMTALKEVKRLLNKLEEVTCINLL